MTGWPCFGKAKDRSQEVAACSNIFMRDIGAARIPLKVDGPEASSMPTVSVLEISATGRRVRKPAHIHAHIQSDGVLDRNHLNDMSNNPMLVNKGLLFYQPTPIQLGKITVPAGIVVVTK